MERDSTVSSNQGTGVSRRSVLKAVGAVAGVAAAGGFNPRSASALARSWVATTPGTAGASAVKGGTLALATSDGVGRDLFIGNSFGPQGMGHYNYAWGLYRMVTSSKQAQPGLAEGYTVSADALTHTCTLRPGITFHDGSPITAADVVANLKAALYEDDPLRDGGTYGMVAFSFGGFPGSVASVEAVDDTTVKVVLTEPRAELRGALSSIMIINPKIMANKNYGTDAGALRDAGSGPFRVEAFSAGDFIEYSRFETFIQPANLDRLRLQLIPDASARFLALKGGQVQGAYDLSKADWDAAASDPTYRVHLSAPYVNCFMAFNGTKNAVLASNDKVRRAIAMSLNRQAYVDSFWPTGQAELGTQVALVPGVMGYNDAIEPIPYDPDGAKKLLAESGVSPDQLKFTGLNPPSFGGVPELGALLEAIAADLAKVGIELTTTITDVAGWLAGTKDNDMFLVPYGNTGGGEESSVVGLYLNRAPERYQIPNGEKYKPAVQQALVATDPEAQAQLLRDVLAEAAGDVAGVPVAYGKGGVMTLASVNNVAVVLSDSQEGAWIEA